MNISDYKEYVRTEDIRLGIATEQPFKVCVHRCWGKNLKPLMDEIATAFRVYQYPDRDNCAEYGKHELFFWTNCERNADGNFPELSYFDVTLNGKTSVEERREVLDRLIPILEKWDGTVVEPGKISYTNHLDGTIHWVEKKESYVAINYHSELIGRDALHLKAMENMMRIGSRKCEYGGMVGHFRLSARETLFQKLRTRKFYYVTDEGAARAKEVA